jgi:hypothetical protein
MILNEKICKLCGVLKPLDGYHRQTKAKDGRQPVCKPCAIARAVKHQRDNAATALPRIKAWGEANKEKTLAYKAKWKRENAGKNAAINSAWKKENLGKVCGYAKKRYAAMTRATPAWANEFFMAEAYSIAKLRTDKTGIQWSVDHIIPIFGETVCGLHVENNLQVIPLSENCRKGTKLMVDF